MILLQKILLPTHQTFQKTADWMLLTLRLLFGGAMLTHGWAKWNNFASLADVFPDPLGVGHTASLVLVIFAEVLCALAVIAGFLHRLALIPLIFTMVIAFFVVHAGDPFATRELAFVYLVVFGALLVTGPGKYSADYLLLHKGLNGNNG